MFFNIFLLLLPYPIRKGIIYTHSICRIFNRRDTYRRNRNPNLESLEYARDFVAPGSQEPPCFFSGGKWLQPSVGSPVFAGGTISCRASVLFQIFGIIESQKSVTIYTAYLLTLKMRFMCICFLIKCERKGKPFLAF